MSRSPRPNSTGLPVVQDLTLKIETTSSKRPGDPWPAEPLLGKHRIAHSQPQKAVFFVCLFRHWGYHDGCRFCETPDDFWCFCVMSMWFFSRLLAGCLTGVGYFVRHCANRIRRFLRVESRLPDRDKSVRYQLEIRCRKHWASSSEFRGR